jgi:TP901 family phage tail tape measure protein
MMEPLSIAAVAGRSTVEEMAGAVAVIGNVYDHILVMADGTARFVKDDMEGAIALTDATREQVSAAVTHTTDVLFEGVRKGRAEVRDYTSQVGDFLMVAAEAGASLEEALALFTSATRITTASQAATWTANFYRQLLRPAFGETLAGWGIPLETAQGTLRPTLDIFKDLVEHISAARSEQAKLNMITEAFPNIRATQAFLRFLGAYQEIVTWSKEWEEVTGQTQEAFELMSDTVNARIFTLKNNIYALGLSFYLAYEDQIKVLIDGLTSIVMLFQTLDPALVRQIALWGLLLVSIAPLMLLIGTIAIGFGTIVTTIGMLVSPGVLGTAGALFMIFGDKLKLAFDALKGFGISDMEDVVQFFMDLAVQLGIISEADAAKILVAFGISIKPMGDPAVLKFIDAFRGMIDRIAVLKNDLVEWFDAFRLLLEDIANREGVIGTIVGYIERIAAAVLPFLGREAAPMGGEVRKVLPGGEAGPEEKKEILEAGIVGVIVTKILAALGITGGGAGVAVLIAGAVYAAMHPEEVETFFTVTLPEWWNGTAQPHIETFFGTTLPEWWDSKALPEIENYYKLALKELQKYYDEKLMPWWKDEVKPIIKKFWEEDLPLAVDENISKPAKGFWEEKLLPWWTEHIKDPVVNFFTTGLREWLTGSVLPSLETLINTTIPNKLGYALGLLLGTGGAVALQTLTFFTETLPNWLINDLGPALVEIFSTDWLAWLRDNFLPLIAELLAWLIEDDIPSKMGGFFDTLIDRIKEAFDSFLAGIKEGFLAALFFWMTDGERSPTDEPPPGGPPPTGGSEFQLGGIIRRTGQVLAHAGEVVFNPRYPRQDLARVVNSAMARVGSGGGGSSISLAPVLNIGSFSGSQAEMTQLQNMLENMSFDMAMRVERKLAEARRVENRRRE